MIRTLRPIPTERIRLLVFDLDGTLIDSAEDLANSVNATLEAFGRRRLGNEQVAGLIGAGARRLVERAFAATGPARDDAVVDRALEWFILYYREHKLDATYAYEGVLEALAALKELHDQPSGLLRQMAVLTNKPVRPAHEICAALGLADYFIEIYGGNSFRTKKPDPEGLRALMNEAGARAEETVVIGDSRVDVETARNAGAWVIGCTYGLQPESLELAPPDVVVDSPSEWPAALAPA
jgi:phosphoglycolate phosphatase